MSNLTRERGRVAALTRSRNADDPELLDARQKLATEQISQYIERTVAVAPPLTSEQRDWLVLKLRGGDAA
jgi:hypothetical protein